MAYHNKLFVGRNVLRNCMRYDMRRVVRTLLIRYIAWFPINAKAMYIVFMDFVENEE